MTKFLNISTDDLLGGVSASDVVVASQKAIKAYVDAQVSGGSIDEKSITKNTDDELQTVGVINNRDSSTAIKTWTGTLAQYNAIATKDNNTIYNITDDTNNNIIYQNGSRNVGDIFYTTRTDTSLNGAVRCNGNTYQTTDFLGDNNIGILLRTNKVMYVSMADYATAIATYGYCKSFGWDGGVTTAFKVPTLPDMPLGEMPVKGNGNGIGYTDGTNTGGIYSTSTSTYRQDSLYNVTVGTDAAGTSPLIAGKIIGITTDGTKSGIVADLTTADSYHAYVQLSTGATDTAISTCTSVSSDVSSLNAHRVIAFQEPTAENNYTWYRKYADGWCEQGQKCATVSPVTYPITMADTNYTLSSVPHYSSDTVTNWSDFGYNKTTTGFSFRIPQYGIDYVVYGKYAQE